MKKALEIMGWCQVMVGIIGLAKLSLDEHKKYVEAKRKLNETEILLALQNIDNVLKSANIRTLEKELEELKAKYEVKKEEV